MLIPHFKVFLLLTSLFLLNHSVAEEFRDLAWKKYFKISPKPVGSYMSGVGRELHGKLVLTFDDGPNQNTLKVLEVLRSYNRALVSQAREPIRGTFFINGWRVAHYDFQSFDGGEVKYATKLLSLRPEGQRIVKQIVADRHILANHSVYHSSLKNPALLSRPWIIQNEIRLTHEAVYSMMPSRLDCRNKWFFRAPFGHWLSQNAGNGNADPLTGKYVGPIGWDIGGEFSYANGVPTNAADWDPKCEADLFQCARGYLNRTYRSNALGGIVLFHDTKDQTPLLLDMLLSVWTGLNPHPIHSSQYRFIERVRSELTYRYGYHQKPRLRIIGLDQVRAFENEVHDKRYSYGGYCH